jgi:hypothetical protein
MNKNKPPHEARQEAHPRYYALNTHRSFRTFGRAEWVDAHGRLYRRADGAAEQEDPYATTVQLDVKLPRADVPWFGPYDQTVELTSTDGSGRRRVVSVVDHYIMQPTHRTGHVNVRRADWE